MTWVAAAAAVLVVAVMISRGEWRLAATEPASDRDPGESGLSIEAQDDVLRLLPGPQFTDSIAGGFTFDAPEGLVVIDEGDGQIVLGREEAAGGDIGRLAIVEVAVSDWEAELRALAAAGEVSLKEIGTTVAGRPATRWDVTLTSKAFESRSCPAREPCIRLDGWPISGPAALWAGADNRIIEIGRTDDSVVLSIETTQATSGQLSLLVARVVSSAALSR